MKQAKRHDIQVGIISAGLALVTAGAAIAAGLVALEFNSRDWTEGWGFRQGTLEFATGPCGRSSSARIPTPRGRTVVRTRDTLDPRRTHK